MLFWTLIAAGAALIVVPAIRITRARRRWTAPPPGSWRYDSKPGYGSLGWGALCLVLFGPVAIFIVLLIASAVGGTQTVTSSQPLVALRTSSSVEGRFFLGTGTVDSKPVIRYIVLADDGAALLSEVEARQARIYQDEEDAPRVDRGSRVLDNPWIAPFPVSLGAGTAYYFHVPAGSVLESYEVTP